MLCHECFCDLSYEAPVIAIAHIKFNHLFFCLTCYLNDNTLLAFLIPHVTLNPDPNIYSWLFRWLIKENFNINRGVGVSFECS